jgi:hypothetical protein
LTPHLDIGPAVAGQAISVEAWDAYTFHKRFEDGDERDIMVEGTLDVKRVPAWGKVQADSDLRLGVLSAKPQLRGLIFSLWRYSNES